MSYIQENLMPNEKVLFTARINPAVFLPSIIVLGLSCFPLALFVSNLPKMNGQDVGASFIADMYFCVSGFLIFYAILLAVQATIAMTTTEFGVTNRRIIAKRGFLRRHTLELFLERVESVSIYQDPLQRLFNFGSVTVTGTGGTRERFGAIIDPIGIRRKINQVIEDLRKPVNTQ